MYVHVYSIPAMDIYIHIYSQMKMMIIVTLIMKNVMLGLYSAKQKGMSAV